MMKEWDAAPVIPIIEEAGGVFTDFAGRRNLHSGNAITSNRQLHGELVSIIRSS
jgi:histidinol-phosphatase